MGTTTRKTRPVSWIRAALKEFETFPEGARSICLAALTIAAEGGKADIEIALPFKGDAFRVVYAVQLADELWVIHAFQKKSTQGIKTPQRDIALVKDRLQKLRERLRSKVKSLNSFGEAATHTAIWGTRMPMSNNSRPSWRPKSSRFLIGNS